MIPVEPSADLRVFASAMRQTYIALTMEGFAEREALVIIGQMIIAANKGGDS